MIEEIQELIDNYTSWLKDKTVLKAIDDKWVKVVTPHLDRHNDCLQFYVRKEDKGFIISDDSYIINDLISAGCALDTPKRQELLKNTLAGFGVEKSGEELIIKATNENFSLKKHNFIQAMLAVNDLFYLASPVVTSLFFEDVSSWLDLSNVRYNAKIKFTGKTGYDHMFDFVIPKFKEAPERIVQTINSPKKEAAEALVFKWLDTKETRPNDAKLYAFLNDSNISVSNSVITAFKSYDAQPVLWSERENVKSELVA
jgi:hypothetical protein